MRESFEERTIDLRIRLVFLTLLCCFCTKVFTAAPTPAAVAVPVGQKWYGYDGNWSPVSIRVGSPPQWLDVFVSTQNRETWVVGVGGCDRTSVCRDKRGGLFQPNTSKTWQDAGYYELGLDSHLGFGGYANYGYDNVNLDEEIIVPSQIVGVINTTDHWLGFFGLGTAITNFTGASKLSFLSSLVENQSLIPSHSYGYTAGAYSRLKHVPASLTLGGYDAHRFVQHNISFNLDSGQNPVAAINSITVSTRPLPASGAGTGWSTDPLTLLGPGDAALFTIDSSTPFLWLPERVCQRFEKALGLTYDNRLQLYTFGVNTSQHEALINWNMTFTFAIADLPGSAKVVNISLPYSAFDLQLSYPFPGLNANSSTPATNYFPLRKAANSSQYTIGRSFLQEAYLIVDYERNNFSVHQATFAIDALTNYSLVDIDKPESSTSKNRGANGSSSLSKSARVGIGVACGIVFAGVIAVLIFCLRKRRGAQHDEKPSSRKYPSRWFRHSPKGEQPSELPGTVGYPFEVSAESRVLELPAVTPQELQGTEVIKNYSHDHDRQHQSQNNRCLDQMPAYCQNTNLVKLKSGSESPALHEYYGPEPSPLTPPAYSPSQVGRRPNSLPRPTTASGDVSQASSQANTPGPSPMTLQSPIGPQSARDYTSLVHTGLTPITTSATVSRETSLLSAPGPTSTTPLSPVSPHVPHMRYTHLALGGPSRTSATTSGDVSRDPSPLSTPGLSPIPVSPHSPAQQSGTAQSTPPGPGAGFGPGGNARYVGFGRSDSRVSRFKEEGMGDHASREGEAGARRPVSERAGEERKGKRYSWED